MTGYRRNSLPLWAMIPRFPGVILLTFRQSAADTNSVRATTNHPKEGYEPMLKLNSGGTRPRGIKIGEILVEQGVLTPDQVEAILSEQKRSARPFGDLAERLFGISPRAIEDAWVTQYMDVVGTTDLSSVRVDVNCLRVLNRRQAWQFHLLPLHRDDGELAMATDDRDIPRALNFASNTVDESVHLLVAERHQLREFLMKHYPVPIEVALFSEKLRRPVGV